MCLCSWSLTKGKETQVFVRRSHVGVNKSPLFLFFPLLFLPGADDGGALLRLSDWLRGLPGALPKKHHGSAGF